MGRTLKVVAEQVPPPVALPWRLPNPPVVFRGRQAERARLVAALERGPLVGVGGPPGVGRTGLVLDVLHRDFAARVPSVLYVSMARAHDIRSGMATIFRALQDGGGRGELDWAPLLRDPLGAATLLIDVVDEAGFWIVLDDLDRAVGLDDVLQLVAAYARRARWVAIGAAGAGQSVALGPLPVGALEAIARDWGHAPDDPAVGRAVREAGGAPRRLEQALRGGPRVRLAALLAQAPHERRLIAALAAVPDGLDLGVLEAVDALPDEARCRALIEHGWIRRQGDSLSLDRRLHGEGALRLVRSEALEQRLLARLEAAPAAGGWMQAVELAAALGDRPALNRILDVRGEALLADGLAPRLAELLRDETAGELRAWRWQAECVMGLIDDLDPALLREDCPPRTMIYVVNALGLKGRWSQVLDLSARCLDRWSEVAEQARWVGHVRVARGWALMQVGRYDAARAMVDGLGPLEPPRMETMALALRAHLLAVAGDEAQAVEIGRRMWRSLEALPDRARKRRMYVTAHLFYRLQRLDEAQAVVRSVVDASDWALLPVQCDRHVLILLAALHGESGRLTEALRCARRAENFLGDDPGVRSSLVCIQSRAAIDGGALGGVMQRLTAMASALGATERADLRVGLDSCALLLALAEGVSPVDARPLQPEPTADPRPESTRRALHALCTLRRGGAYPTDGAAHGPEARLWWAIVRATRQMLAGAPAADALREARAVPRARGMLGLCLFAQQAVCEALLLEGRLASLPAEAALLRTFAADSPRFRAEARFFDVCARPEGLAVWQAITEAEGACAAARRARAVLGQPTALDALDRRIVAAVRDRPGGPSGPVVGWPGAESGIAWALHGQRGVVEGPDGRRLDLSRTRVLHRLLVALAEAGGSSGKEALVEAVWQVDAYHPLKHDNRLRVAVRKLRGLLADRAGLADVLLTLDDGYALRGPCRWRP